MANVTDSASLLTIPSGWSDGVLGSLKPDDGTGDFTFSRGSDLSATRVKKNGYIEKGYENLLLQSNTFSDTSAWSYNEAGNCIVTGGQAGYDGTNDAWEAKNDGRAYFRQIVTYPSQVKTFSIYAKSGNQDYFSLYVVKDGGDPSATCDLGLGTITNDDIDNIDATITPVVGATGWYRVSVAWLSASTGYDQLRIVTGHNLGDTIYIQDAMLNQGLVAYPYLETGTTTAKSTTILEDQPRIDYTSGNGAVLIEPNRTNAVKFSEYIKAIPAISDPNLIFWDSSILNPEGYNGAIIYQSTTIIRDGFSLASLATGTKISYSIFAKSDSDVRFIVGGMFGGENATFNVKTGTFISKGAACDSYEIIPFGNGWHRYVVNITYQNTYNNGYSYAYLRWYSSTEPIYLWGWQAEKDATSSSSYIPTYGTSSTRAKDTATLTKNVASTGTIYMNINSDSAKTLTFLGGNVSVIKGTNKIAMAYSPTALKISHNGSVVQNITRAFDTASLTQIQLGHRNNFEQTTDGISQFLTLDSFLSDADLNELTA